MKVQGSLSYDKLLWRKAMKKMGFSIVLVFLMVSLLFAEDTIQPFGNILWTDGFVEVVKKINVLEPDTLLLKLSTAKVDIKGLVDKKALSAKLGEVLKGNSSFFFKPEARNRVEVFIKRYKDVSGKEKMYAEKTYDIVASNIVIAGVPFELEVTLEPLPGFAVDQPDNVMVENKIGYTFPLVVTKVQLLSRSPILADKYKEINDILDQKYRKYDKNKILDFVHGSGGNLCDSKENSIHIYGNKTQYVITYESKAYLKDLAERYRKHLADLETGVIEKKKDSRSGL